MTEGHLTSLRNQVQHSLLIRLNGYQNVDDDYYILAVMKKKTKEDKDLKAKMFLKQASWG